MKLHDERLQWILDNLDEFKRAIVTVDDFSVLYGILDDARNDDDLNLRDFA